MAHIFREFGEGYRRNHPLPLSHLKVMHAIEVCRTSYLGGHLEQCDSCGYQRPVYNSCRNRHCPKCQALTKARWLAARRAELLPVGYFHTVFTLPHWLNPLARANQRQVYDLLFQSVAETLQEFGADPKHGLGGKLGFTAILHTWDQKLRYHLHLHCLIAGGALSRDGMAWTTARPNFLFPVRALSRAFRGKFIHYLQKAFQAGQLVFPGQATSQHTQEAFRCLIQRLWSQEWVVYSKRPFAGPQQVLDYLGRYTHRVAIANHRIKRVDDGYVTFSYRDRKHGDRFREMTLGAEAFIRRFLLHVLPQSYVRIRHFGFLANRGKKLALTRCRELLGVRHQASENLEDTPDDTHALILRLIGLDLTKCPACPGGSMAVVEQIPRFTASEPAIRPQPGLIMISTAAYGSGTINPSNGSSSVLSPLGNCPSACVTFSLMTPPCLFYASKVPDQEPSVTRQVSLMPPQKGLSLQFLPFESP
jgi:hypothetical protein